MKFASKNLPKRVEKKSVVTQQQVVYAGDPERALLNAFFSANDFEQEKFIHFGLGMDLFHTHDEMFGWIFEFYETHSRVPSIQAFATRFPNFVHKPIGDPVDYYVAELTSRKTHDTVRKMSKELFRLMEKGDQKSMAEAVDTIRKYVDRMGVMENTHDVDYAKGSHRRLSNYQSSNGVKFVCDTPWPSMNNIIIGLEPEDVVSVMARSGVGKTWFLTRLVEHIWLSCEQNVLFFTKEMSEDQISRRFDAMGAGVCYDRLRVGALDDDEKERVRTYIDKIDAVPQSLTISGDESFEGKGLQDIYGRIKKYRPDVVIIDGAYLLVRDTDIVRGMVQLSRQLKRIAKVCRVPIICVYQTNRTAELKGGQTGGGLSSISWGDSIIQDSNIVIELAGRREEFHRDVVILKSRESRTGTFSVRSFTTNGVPFFKEEQLGDSPNGVCLHVDIEDDDDVDQDESDSSSEGSGGEGDSGQQHKGRDRGPLSDSSGEPSILRNLGEEG